jgi:hypothetical protein
MNAYDYLNNPVIKKGFYNVKCIDVDEQAVSGSSIPLVIIELKIVPWQPYATAQNQVLFVTLQPALNAKPLHDNFKTAFRIKKNCAEAMGRFASVLVDCSEYKGKKYGAVHFIDQSPIARKDAKDLEQADSMKEIEWEAVY